MGWTYARRSDRSLSRKGWDIFVGLCVTDVGFSEATDVSDAVVEEVQFQGVQAGGTVGDEDGDH